MSNLNPNLSIYCDGGSRGNPGPAASAFVVLNSSEEMLFEHGVYLGTTTNNQAEYQAVIEALNWLTTNLASVDFYLDSQLVVQQITGNYQVKDPNIKIKYQEVKKLMQLTNVSTSSFHYIPRAQNFRADALVNSTLDSQ